MYHATLQLPGQLADELPMIYVASYYSAVLFDLQPGSGFSLNTARCRLIMALLIPFNVIFTWALCVQRSTRARHYSNNCSSL